VPSEGSQTSKPQPENAVPSEGSQTQCSSETQSQTSKPQPENAVPSEGSQTCQAPRPELIESVQHRDRHKMCNVPQTCRHKLKASFNRGCSEGNVGRRQPVPLQRPQTCRHSVKAPLNRDCSVGNAAPRQRAPPQRPQTCRHKVKAAFKSGFPDRQRRPKTACTPPISPKPAGTK